jgi:hypothetical protein
MKSSPMISNWLAGLLLVVATISLVGKIAWDKVKGQAPDAGLTLGTSLFLGVCWLGYLIRFIQAEWLMLALLLVQFIMLIIALMKFWPAYKRMTRS